jgi:hypothetical protein
MAHPVTKGSILAITGYRTVDNFRIHPSHGFIIYTEPVNHSGAEAFHHNIGFFDQPEKNLFALIGFQIERHMLFIAIDRIEKQAVCEKLTAFNCDHPGTMIGKNH